MNSKWLQFSKDEQEKESTRLLVKNSKTILGLLGQLLTKELQDLEKTSPDNYEISNWPYWRADRDGQVRAIKNLIKLMGDHPNNV